MASIVSSVNTRRVEPPRQARAIGVLTLAFNADPVCRWCWPGADQFLEGFPAFARAFGGRAFVDGTAYEIAQGQGAALWLAPGVGPDEAALMAVIEDAMPARLRGAVFSLMEEMDARRPKYEHWYLPLIGVEPTHQGQGLGAQLMRPVLERCDEQALPAYLESTNPRNIPFYERLGFRRVRAIQVADSPPLTTMLREPCK
jgi:GNAT superfamily N-acetyltransferase